MAAKAKKKPGRPRKLDTPLAKAIAEGMKRTGVDSMVALEEKIGVPKDSIRDICRSRTRRNRALKLSRLALVSDALGIPLLELVRVSDLVATDREYGKKDFGTPEVQIRKAILARGGDPSMCGSPLGVLLARHEAGRPGITKRQYGAAIRYAVYHARAYGLPSTPNILAKLSDDEWRPPPATDTGRAMAREMFGRSEAVLAAHGGYVHFMVYQHAILDDMQSDLIVDYITSFAAATGNRSTAMSFRKWSEKKLESLRKALDDLADWYKSPEHRYLREWWQDKIEEEKLERAIP